MDETELVNRGREVARGGAPDECIRVLIADDGARVRSAMKALLSTLADVEVVGEACDGREALRLAERLHPDVIMLDVRMPYTNGLETAREVKRRWPGTRVVVLTICGEHRDAALACGADAFLVKGCSLTEIANALIPEQAA